jgi:hypothetical protein
LGTGAKECHRTRIISTKSADEYDRIRGEFSRHLYDLLTTPLASESLPSKPDRSKPHAPIVVKTCAID